MQRNLIFTRDVTTPLPAITWPEGVAVHTMATPADPTFAPMDRMYVANGFREGWAAGLLKGTARAITANASTGECLAAAWLLREPFYISEIGRTFDPGPEGDYYFGDFVAPDFRGRGLQRALILHRFSLSASDNRRRAVAMTTESNAASCKNYLASGFVVAAHLTSRCLGKFSFDRLHLIDSSRSFGHFSHRGFHLPFGIEIYRCR